MLADLEPLLPKDNQIYVLFDSWYASAKLIKFCFRKGFNVICRIKHNRKLNGKRVSSYAKRLRNKSFNKVMLSSATHLTSTFKGFINDFGEEVKVIISKRHPRDRYPEYFLSTDTSLKAKEVLNYYERRWQVEIDHLYLKTRLGLGDFRLRTVEGITKYLTLCLLALAYLQHRLVKDARLKNISQVIFKHRQEHFQLFLKEVCKMTLEKVLLNQYLKDLCQRQRDIHL
ncbi:MAG: transposase [Actinomycetota bacterium]|nr:transposase [Actinomycetota bacterium]